MKERDFVSELLDILDKNVEDAREQRDETAEYKWRHIQDGACSMLAAIARQGRYDKRVSKRNRLHS